MADFEDLAGLFSKFIPSEDKENDGKGNDSAESVFGDIDIDMILRLMEMFEQMNKSDKNTDLLIALKPHLRDENKDKIDKAIKLVKLMTIIPILKDSGILGGFNL